MHKPELGNMYVAGIVVFADENTALPCLLFQILPVSQQQPGQNGDASAGRFDALLDLPDAPPSLATDSKEIGVRSKGEEHQRESVHVLRAMAT
jgi:hypothetical protein